MSEKLILDSILGSSKIKHPRFSVGDVVEVHVKIKEGDKERIQIFKGIVIAIKNKGVSKTFTVRKISYGVGVEKIFPLYAPVITKIKVVKTGKVKRSKLYYMRARVGKLAMKVGNQIPVEGKDYETMEEEVKAKTPKEEKEEKETPKEESASKV